MSDKLDPTDGLHLKGNLGELWLSEKALGDTVASFERILDHFLDWSKNSPFQFFGVLGLLGFVVFQNRLAKNDTAKFKAEFEKRRASSKQPSLPFDG